MNNMQAFITLIFVAGFFGYNLIIGTALLEFMKVKGNKCLAVISGLVTTFALTEIISLPFMMLQGSYDILCISLISTFFFLTIVSLHYLLIVKKDHTFFKLKLTNLSNISVLIIIVLIIIQTIVPTFFARFDGDDAFYIAISTSLQTTRRVFLNNPSIGLDKFPFPPNYRFASFEILITVISDLLRFDPVVVYHSLLPLVLIPTYYMAYYALAKSLYPENFKKRVYFILTITLLSLFDGYSNYLPSSFILLKAWMGKSSLINICFPLLLSFFIEIFRIEDRPTNFKRNKINNYFILISITLIGAAGTSAVGLYLLPVYYLTIFLGSLLTLQFGKNSIKRFFEYIFKAFVSSIPSILLLLGYLIMILKTNGIEQLTAFESNRTWVEEASLLLNGNLEILILYLISFFYFLFFGKNLERAIYVLAPLILFATFLNPLLHNVVGHYLTSLPVYWRLFWLIPIFSCIASFIVEASRLLKLKKLSILLVIPFILICNPYNFGLNDTKYYKVENSAKIPDDIANVTNAILDNVTTTDPNDLYLLALPKYNIYIRQYTGKISLVMPRMNFVQEAFEYIGEGSDFSKVESFFTFDDDKIIQGFTKEFNLNYLKDLNINLIITPTKRAELQDIFSELLLENGEYLYIRNDIFK